MQWTSTRDPSLSLVTKHSLDDLTRIADMIAKMGIKLWALFFLIAIGCAARPEVHKLNILPHDFEQVFNWMYDLSKSAPYDITPREGYHYRQVMLQRRAQELGLPVEDLLKEVLQKSLRPTDVVPAKERPKIVQAPMSVKDGRGVVFISHVGIVQPSGFLPLAGGSVREKTARRNLSPIAFIRPHPRLFTTQRKMWGLRV